MYKEFFDVYLPRLIHDSPRDLREVVRMMIENKQAVIDFMRWLDLRRKAQASNDPEDGYWLRFSLLMSEVLGLKFSDSNKKKVLSELGEFARVVDRLFREGTTMRVRLVRESPFKMPTWFRQNKGKIFEVYRKREGGYDVDLAPVGHPGEWGFMHDQEVEEIPG